MVLPHHPPIHKPAVLLREAVFLFPCSHVLGHDFSGNVCPVTDVVVANGDELVCGQQGLTTVSMGCWAAELTGN